MKGASKESLSAHFKDTDTFRQIARLEKELDFWGTVYPKGKPAINGTTTSQQVKQLQYRLRSYREIYREELEKSLGEDFSIEPLNTQNSNDSLGNYFFPMDFQEKFAGIILPFRKEKKAVFNPRIKDNKHALGVLQNKGYRIEQVVCGYNRNEASYLILGDEEYIALGLSMKDLI